MCLSIEVIRCNRSSISCPLDSWKVNTIGNRRGISFEPADNVEEQVRMSEISMTTLNLSPQEETRNISLQEQNSMGQAGFYERTLCISASTVFHDASSDSNRPGPVRVKRDALALRKANKRC